MWTGFKWNFSLWQVRLTELKAADLAAFMQSDVCTGMELVQESAVGRFRDVLGPTDAAAAKSCPRY